MPECHNCEHNGKAYEIPWQDHPCSRCLDRPLTRTEIKGGYLRWTGNSEMNSGRSKVSLDSGEGQTYGEMLVQQWVDAEGRADDENYVREISRVVDKFRIFLHQLLTLPADDMRMITLRFLNQWNGDYSYRRIARSENVSHQAAAIRFKKILRKWPAIRALFAEEKTSKEGGR